MVAGGVEAAVGSQPHQHRHGDLGKVQGQLGRVVAAVEHNPWHGPAGRQPLQERADLHGGGVVGVVQRMQPPRVHRRVVLEAQLHDPLERPASEDRLVGRIPRGVVVAPLG
jgi:hypothetical protein